MLRFTKSIFIGACVFATLALLVGFIMWQPKVIAYGLLIFTSWLTGEAVQQTWEDLS